ncbi:hypothetical protein LCGC14_1929560 [marine sediment metagenome]|uniref:Uncharacterized protein n=1 Tax=marine sediment metagenome TaxID=412755 RepID=A0A0F9FP03_9ZZZZ
MEFTKGEWKVTDSAFSRYTTYRSNRTGGRAFVTVTEDLEQVAEAQGSTQEEAEANAHLIAAAPAMYEALKTLIIHPQPVVVPTLSDAQCRAELKRLCERVDRFKDITNKALAQADRRE